MSRIMELADQYASEERIEQGNARMDLQAEVSRVEAELAAAQADAAHCRKIARIRYGYAEGFYSNQCHQCKKLFDMSDKRCVVCMECADAAIDAAILESKK